MAWDSGDTGWLIEGAAAALFLGVMGWGIWRDFKDEKQGKKD
jgi:hypothetical protein